MLAKVLLVLFCLATLAHGYGLETVINFVTDGGASTSAADNSAAFAHSVALATSTGYPIYIPPGTYKFTKAINSTDIIVRGAGTGRSIFQWTTNLANYVAAYEVYGSLSVIQHLGLITVYGRAVVGSAPCHYYGIRLNANANLYYVTAQTFYAGIVWNSPTGHTVSEHVHSTNNYYGLYVQNSNGDNYIGLSGLEGNTMASVGIPSAGTFGSGDMIFRTHLGFGPYGVYQEGPSTNGVYNNFLFDAHFQLARFEACGNGAIFTENIGTASYGGIRDTEFYNVGFSWSTEYRIASKAADYAVDVGTVQNDCYYFPGGSPFNPGAKGTFNLNQAVDWGHMHEFATTVCCTS